MRQLQQDENTDPERVRLEIAQPNCSALYYSNCGRVDQHNRARQDGLKLETKYGTHDWSRRVNLSLLSVCIVDAFYVYRGCRELEETFNEFVHKLADEMIEYGLTTRYQRATANFGFGSAAESSKRARSSIVRLTPQKKRRTPDKLGSGNSRKQRWCSSCKDYKTTWLCSHCPDEVAICHTKERPKCFDDHCKKAHAGLLCQIALDR